MYLALVLLLSWGLMCSNEEDIMEKFVPTSEWAEIKEGQSIGRGLHARLNLATGKKEAKLLSEEDKQQTGLQGNSLTLAEDSIVDVGILDSDSVDELEEGWKHGATSDDTTETVSGKFRTIEDLKKLMPNLEMKTEGQVLKERIERLNKTTTSEIANLIIMLEEIEDLAHKFDNGQLLATEGWMNVVGVLLHHQDVEVYRAALRVVSSAAQSNPTVQKYCIEHGYLSFLVSQLPSQPEKLAKSTVFCISAIMRNLPAALQALADLQGYKILSTELVHSSLGPLQRVILSFYNELLEQDIQSKSDKVHKSIKVESALLCKKISEILSETESGHDVLQETVVFYSRTRQWCDSNMSSTISDRLKDIMKLLETQEEGELTTLYNSILSVIESVI